LWPTGRERSRRDIIIISGPSPEEIVVKNHERLLISVLSLNESITFCFLSYAFFQNIFFSQFLGKKSVLIKLTDMLKCVLYWTTFTYVLLDDIRRCLVGRHSPMSCWTTFADILLDAFAKLWKATNNFFMSVCPCVRKEHLGWKWIAFHEIWYFTIFRKFVEEIHVLLKSDKNNGYFTCRPIHIYVNISLNSSKNNKLFRENYTENQNILCSIMFFSPNRTVYEIMCKNTVQQDMSQMAIRLTCNEC
jgi:hypothetical protein